MFLANDCQFKWKHERLNWVDDVEQLEHEDQFDVMYRMSLDAFNQLVVILRPKINVGYKQSFIRSTPDANDNIYQELIVAIGIWWLSGGVYHLHLQTDAHIEGLIRPSGTIRRDPVFEVFVSVLVNIIGSSRFVFDVLVNRGGKTRSTSLNFLLSQRVPLLGLCTVLGL